MKRFNKIIYKLVYLLLFTTFSSQAATSGSELRQKLEPALELSVFELQIALDLKIKETFDGALIIADDDDNTFLGKIVDSLQSDSIFNELGKYGSDLQPKSIWNDIGTFGSDIGRFSPFNDLALRPPRIVKDGKVIGYLTVNKLKIGGINPFYLKVAYE